MPKRVNNIFDDNLKFKYMYEAYERASEGKRECKEVILYEMDLANNITTTLKELLNGTYRVGKYNEFKITRPRERSIKGLPFKDKVVQQWYVEQFIKPIFIPKFIVDSYACTPGKGVNSAVQKLKRYMYNANQKNPDSYILKCDISKFFYAIDKSILYKIIERYIKDEKVLKLTKIFIYDNRELVGIPIGNYASQYFANIYMSIFDHFIKEKCKIKYYVRYADDFVLILENKEQCKKIKKEIEEFLEEKLHLKLNNKTNYFKLKDGVNFLGYKVFSSHILIKSDKKRKMYKKIREFNKLYKKNELNVRRANMTINSWKAHTKNADAYNLMKDTISRCEWLYKEEEIIP